VTRWYLSPADTQNNEKLATVRENPAFISTFVGSKGDTLHY